METIVSEPFDENSYVLFRPDQKECVIVDPGFEPDKIFAYIEQQQLTPVSILNTHGHADHIAGNEACKERWPEVPLVIGRNDAAKLTDPNQNLSGPFGMPIVSPAADQLLDEGDTYRAAGFDFEVFEIPGHSIGHIVLIERSCQPVHVVGGDVLFAGSIGRCDFPDGNFEALAAGIHQKLFPLPDDTIVLPGHGPTTTIGIEKRNNPFVGAPAGYRPLDD